MRRMLVKSRAKLLIFEFHSKIILSGFLMIFIISLPANVFIPFLHYFVCALFFFLYICIPFKKGLQIIQNISRSCTQL